MTITLQCRSGQYRLNGKEITQGKSWRVVNHSPDGFNHGYGGSGPAQLALAICLELLDNDIPAALSAYQRFKWDVVAGLPHGDFNQVIDINLKINA